MAKNSPKISIDGSKAKIIIVATLFNEELVNELLENTLLELKKSQTKKVEVFRVAGALEAPFACQKIANDHKPDAIIALGVVIRGETTHYELVTETCYQGLMRAQLNSNTPIVFGILGCENEKQALQRVKSKGAEFAQAALLQSKL